jgi:hypothetical protein
MRKGQRFTPKRLQKWIEQGRGTGSGEHYQPWHQVTRSDPGSRGRSHLVNSSLSRLHHFLSDLELVQFTFATMLPSVVDMQEQCPLSLEDGRDVFNHDGPVARFQPGAPTIALELGVSYPMLRRDGEIQPWVMTTDLLLTFAAGSADRQVAVSVKPKGGFGRKRQHELFAIEREYWLRRGVPWLLVTPDQYDTVVARSIGSGAAWALGMPPVASELQESCARWVAKRRRPRFGELMNQLPAALGVDQMQAQCAFWQAVWSGVLPINLGFDVRPASTLELLEPQAFWHQNPIAARRSAWTA